MLRKTLFTYLFVGFVAVSLLAGGAWKVVDTKTVYMAINNSGDTAEVTKFHDFTARDSFTYIDTLGPGSGSKTATPWTSPVQVRRLTPTLDTTKDYVCSVDLGTNKYGFVWDAGGLTQNTLAALIDTLVDSINNVAGMSDTVTAHDSVTYIKVVTDHAQDRLEGDARWTFAGLSAECPETDSTFTTVAMVCDSMTAAINATAALLDSLTAANDGDTVYTVTGDRPGWDIYTSVGDTAQDTNLVTAAVTSYSTFQDTIDIGRVIFNTWHATSIDGRFILSAAADVGDVDTDTILGIGKADSGYLVLCHKTTRGDYAVAAADTSATLPCTLVVSVADAEGNNVVFADMLALIWRVADTASDTTGMTIDFDIDYDYTLKD